MKKSELLQLLRNHSGHTFNLRPAEEVKAMNKKELKAYINEHGGFSRGKVTAVENSSKPEGIPEGAIYLEAEISDESENHNGYVIELEAWNKSGGLTKFFNEYGGKVLYQHNINEPIGKTLSIEIKTDDNGRKYLGATGYAYDDYTDKRLSRGLTSDISTGHIPLVIVYRHRETGEELTYEAYNEMLDTLVDKLIDEGRNFGYIWDALQNKIAEYQERHREVQLIEWSVVTLGSNANAEVKVIKNSMEEAKSEFTEEELNASVEQDNPESPEGENQEEKIDQDGENHLKNEGGTPEADNDTPPKDSENEDDGEKESDPSENEGDEEQEGKGSENEQTPPDNPEPQTNSSQELVNLKANEIVLKKQIETLQAENQSLKTEKSELQEKLDYFTNKKTCKPTDLKENRTDAKRLEQLKANVARILRQ
ncbi:MAG: hypothetical protein HG424_003655 [candidate division SR1 bacterium]|nr:hypothetical protein [candidate division SR1 bacterium]